MITGRRTIRILVEKLQGGGAEDVVVGWAVGLAELGQSVEIGVLAGRTESRFDAELSDAGVKIIHLCADERPSLRERLRATKTFMKSVDEGVVISVLTMQNLMALVLRPKSDVLLLCTEHNVPSILLRSQGLSQRIQLLIARRMYRRADLVGGVSHAVLTDLRSNFSIPSERLVLLRNPILPDIRPTPDVSIESLELMVPGRLVPQKTPLFALDIADEAAKSVQKVRIAFVGDGPLEAEIRERAKSSLADVRILPWRDDWMMYAEKGSIALLPSDVEGFGNVLVKAASAGIKCVVPASALGTGDAIVPGVTGEIASRRSVESFVRALKRVRNTRAEISWERQFTVREAATELLSVIGELDYAVAGPVDRER